MRKPRSRRPGRKSLRFESLEERALLAGTPVQVMLMVGQSNMGGYGSNSDLRAPYDAPQTDVWIWQDDLSQNVGWTSLRGGFGGDTNKGSGGNGPQFGPEVSFGRALENARPESQFALIKHVQGGTGATMHDGWNPDRGNGLGPGQIWIDFIAKTREALDALTASQLEYQVAGLMVQQGRDGVNETGVEAANYEQNFTHFIEGVRQEFGVPQLPVVFAEQSYLNVPDPLVDANTELVGAGKEAVDAADPFATMVQCDDLSRLVDDVHLDTEGQLLFGQRFANVYFGAPYEGAARAGRDGFETGNFTGGYDQWTAGAWTVTGDATVTTTNFPHLGAYHAQLRNSTGDIVRAVDATGLANLKLRFWSKLSSFESGDKAYVKVSADGTNWATLRAFVDGEDTNTYRFHEIDVPELGDTIYVRFDAQMDQSSDYWYIDDVKVVGTTNAQPVEEVSNKFFVVDDASTDRNYEYTGAVARVDDYSLGVGNTAPRGAAATAAGTRVWVTDKNRNVYVYDNDGKLQGQWSAGSLASNAAVEGIATNGADVWLVDSSADRVYRYNGAAGRLSDSQNAASSFNLNNGNKNPKDLVTDGTHIWVVDDSSTDKVFKYTLSGSLVGSWTITTNGATSPTGITLDPSAPSGPNHLWIVDSGTDRIYQYDDATMRTNSSQGASRSFALAAGNTNPQGIADPPTDGAFSFPEIAISDATAIEGSDQLKLLDQFIAPGSGGLTRPRVPKFGPDSTGDGVDELYVASADTDEILRYDGSTGAFLDVFVAQGSGGLDGPGDLEFGPDGELYVSSFENGRVLRYDGQTGEFLDEIANGLDRPLGLSFDSDGTLYIATNRGSQVFRYKNSALSLFIPAGSGGLNTARHAVIGPDVNGDGNGDLYVDSQGTQQVLRYDGVTGAFIDVFATLDAPAAWMEFGPDGDLYAVSQQFLSSSWDIRITRFDTATREVLDVLSSGQANWAIMIDPQNIVYNSNIIDQSVYRYGPSSLAAFSVSLSAPSPDPITVDFQTSNGSAAAGTDYVATSGTLTFAPGQTSRTILVPTVDNGVLESSETFTVLLTNAVGATIADDQGAGTIYDDETPLTKFYVVDDASQNRTFEYGSGGGLVESYGLNSGNSAPRGVATTLAGDKTWVIDANRKVYVYNTSGALLGSWTAGSLANNATPEGIATNGTDVWIVDGRSDKVFRYDNAASLTSGNPTAASSFNLAAGNTNPKDIVTDGASLWVVDDAGKTDKVFKYTLSGTPLGSWTIDAGNKAPTGITIDPANLNHIWIADSGTDRVYQYNGAATTTSGSLLASATFTLAPGNTNPQGIADPPASAEAAVSATASAAVDFPSLSTSAPSRNYTPSRRPTHLAATQSQTFSDLNLQLQTNRADGRTVVGSRPRASIDSGDRAIIDTAFASLGSDRWSELAADTLAI